MPYDTLVSDEAGQDLFVSLSPELPDSVLAKAHASIMQRTTEPHRSCIEEDGIRYTLQSTPIRMEGVLRHVVTIEKSRLSIPLGKYGIAILTSSRPWIPFSTVSTASPSPFPPQT